MSEVDQKWIDQQRAVCEAATPGPWLAMKKGNKVPSFAVVRFPAAEGPVSIASSISPKGRDYEFIAAARTVLPASLDALEAAYAEIARLASERDAAHAKLLQIYRYALTKQEETAFDELFSAMWDIRQIAMHGDAR